MIVGREGKGTQTVLGTEQSAMAMGACVRAVLEAMKGTGSKTQGSEVKVAGASVLVYGSGWRPEERRS